MTRLPTSIPAFAGLCALMFAPISAALLAIAPAGAQTAEQNDYYGPYAGASWSTHKLLLKSGGECTAIINHGALGLDAAGTKFVKERYESGNLREMMWSGTCDANRLISGSGILVFDIFGTSGKWLKGFEGTAERGILDGYAIYYPSEDEEEPGIDVRFIAGCNNWNGKRPNSCDAARGITLRDQYLASPPSQAATLNAQQNAAAAAWLKADTEAKRVQAQKVADFERKQAEFNRQQAEYVRQQEEYKAALAAQQAEVARITKANADAQACFKGDKSRCK